MKSESILSGVRVIEWSAFAFGPLAGLMLADMGAEVIKIEDPSSGDPARNARWMIGSVDCALPGDRNALFETFNRNKRSITINLKSEAGRAILFRLLATSDVFLHNFRQRAAKQLGVSYDDICAQFPHLVYGVGSGYGPKGPHSERPGLDYVGQARSGLMWGSGAPTDPPYYNTGGTADMIGGIMLAFGLVSALFAKSRSGVGQKVDVSHLGASMWLQKWAIGVSQLTQLSEWPRFDRSNAGNPLWNHYKCADGKWVALSLLQADRYWPDLAEAIERPELLSDERFKDVETRKENNKALICILEEVFAQRPRQHWEDVLSRYPDFIWDRVQTIGDLPTDPQVLENSYLAPFEYPGIGKVLLQTLPVTFSRTPASIESFAPSLGQHTHEVLTDSGYTSEEIADLAASGAI